MPVTRREVLNAGFLASLSLAARPLFAFLPESSVRASSEELFQHLGIDGQTVLTARHLPVIIDHLHHPLAWHIVLDNVDLQLNNPRIDALQKNRSGKYRPDEAVAGITATIPTVTGHPAHFVARAGYLDQDGKSHVAYDPNRQSLGTYTLMERFYDNKVVNASLALLELARSMQERGIGPGEEFSYLERARIGELLEGRKVLPGFGISGRVRTPMYGGGICSSVTTIAKMARQLEHAGQIEITRFKSHSVRALQYFYNPDDPTPGQIDATAFWPSVDLRFRNLTDQTVFVVPKVQIIPDEQTPMSYSGLLHDTAILAFSTSLRNFPPTPDEIGTIETQIGGFRELRSI